MNELIQIVDDDADLRALLALALTSEGFRTIESSDGTAALDDFTRRRPDLVVLDIGLGPRSVDGFEVCRQIRRLSDVPVSFLTTRTDETDQLIGFMVGADDYISKPVSPRLVTARVRSVLRRSAEAHDRRDSGSDSDTFALVGAQHELSIDLEARIVRVAGRSVELSRIQFDLLIALAENPSRVLTRQQLISRVWGEWFGSDHHLDVHLSRLRARLVEAGGPRIAHAVRGVGFRFTA